jgi:hypothetical protein
MDKNIPNVDELLAAFEDIEEEIDEDTIVDIELAERKK